MSLISKFFWHKYIQDYFSICFSSFLLLGLATFCCTRGWFSVKCSCMTYSSFFQCLGHQHGVFQFIELSVYGFAPLLSMKRHPKSIPGYPLWDMPFQKVHFGVTELGKFLTYSAVYFIKLIFTYWIDVTHYLVYNREQSIQFLVFICCT